MKTNSFDADCVVKIESITDDGKGVAHKDGFTYFVSGAIPEDVVKIKISKKKKRYAFADVVSFESVSHLSVDPPTKFNNCSGGAPISRLQYLEQLKQKDLIVKNAFRRIAKIQFAENMFKPILGMDSPNRYRNKARYACTVMPDGKIGFGSYLQGTHQILFEHDSIIYKKENASILDEIKLWANSPASQNDDASQCVISELVIRTTQEDKKLIAIISECKPQNISELINKLTNKFSSIESIVWQDALTNKTKPLYGAGSINDKLANLKFKISANTFFQVNHLQTELLYSKIIEYADLKGDEQVWDLYCGVGSISLLLAKKADIVRGNDISNSSISNAKENAVLNSIGNIFFECAKTSMVLPKWKKQYKTPALIVLDPPRSGCSSDVLKTLLLVEASRIIYVSCNPATLARDVAILSEKYQIKKIQPVDMFPHTAHIEIICVLEKK